MNRNFFVLGLPRSRTAWLANCLTFGESFCFHDGLAGCMSVGEYKEKLQKPGYSLVGDSDSGLLFLDLNYLFPDSPKLIIHRDLGECQASMQKAGFQGAEYFPLMQPLLMKFNGLHIMFEEIDSRIDEIVFYLTGQRLDEDRKQFLLNCHLQIFKPVTGDSFLFKGV